MPICVSIQFPKSVDAFTKGRGYSDILEYSSFIRKLFTFGGRHREASLHLYKISEPFTRPVNVVVHSIDCPVLFLMLSHRLPSFIKFACSGSKKICSVNEPALIAPPVFCEGDNCILKPFPGVLKQIQ